MDMGSLLRWIGQRRGEPNQLDIWGTAWRDGRLSQHWYYRRCM